MVTILYKFEDLDMKAQEKAKQYEKRNSINQSVEQQQGAN
jgi:hypothetical protein